MHKYKYLIFITEFSFPVIQVNKRYSVPLSCTLFTSSKIFTLLFQNFLSLNITGLEGAITRVSKDVTSSTLFLFTLYLSLFSPFPFPLIPSFFISLTFPPTALQSPTDSIPPPEYSANVKIE